MLNSFAHSQRFIVAQKNFLYQVYLWMGAAVLLTAISAALTAQNELFLSLIYGDGKSFSAGLLVLVLAEVGLVFYLSSKVFELRFETGIALFALYSVLNGMTLSSLFLIYTSDSLASTFFICSSMFFSVSLYGWMTKADLSRWGNILFMGVIGLLLASLVNFFLKSDTLSYLVSFVGVLVFTGLTAYDTWKLKKVHEELEGQPEMSRKLSVLGALSLYLDFINLFLMMLRFLGRREE